MTRNTLLSYGCAALLLLSGCGDNSSGGGNTPPPTTTPPPPTVSPVSGTVVDEQNNPIANASVLVLGSNKAPVTTSSTGTFSIPDVAASYDIAAASSTRTRAVVYKGLTLRSVTLHLRNDAPSSSSHTATVKGTLSGGQTPYTDKNRPSVSFFSPSGSVGSGASALSASAYSVDLSWEGAPSITGSLYAFQAVQGASGGDVPASFTGYGRRDNVSLVPNATISSQDIRLDSVATSTLGIGMVVPSGFTPLVNTVYFTGQADTFVPLFTHSMPSGLSFNYPVPQIPSATFAVYALASAGSYERLSAVLKTGLSAGSSNTTLTLPAPLQLNQPAASATNVALTTDFSWSGLPVAGAYTLSLEKVSSGGAPYSLNLYTADTHTALPNLTALGMPLPAGTSFSWSVSGTGTYASLDAMMTQGTNPPVQFIATHDVVLSTSARQSFTTASAP